MDATLKAALNKIAFNAEAHAHKRPNVGLSMLVEEVGELAEALNQDSKPGALMREAMIYELSQIGGIVANWIAALAVEEGEQD